MKRNYLAEYSGKTRKLQEGGAAPGPPAGPEAGMEAGGAPPAEGQPGAGGDLEAMIMQVVQSQDPNLALQVVNAIAQAMGIGGGGGAPAGPEGGAPPPEGGYGMKMGYGAGGAMYGNYPGNQGQVGATGMFPGSPGSMGQVGAGGHVNYARGNQGKVGGSPMGRYGMKLPIFRKKK